MTNAEAVQGRPEYVSGRETGTHTVTFWHAEFTVYYPCPSGGSYCLNYRCTHDHTSRATAQGCETRLMRVANRLGSAVEAVAAVKRI
jgi:hypothetical protein